MKKNDWVIILTLSFSIFISDGVFSQPIGKRIFGDTGYLPGVPVHVALVFTPEVDVTYTIMETLPNGWSVSDFERNNSFIQVVEQNGVITWNVTYSRPIEVRLTYSVIPPLTASEEVVFLGTINEQEITGYKTLNIRPLRPIGDFQDLMFRYLETGEFIERFGDAQFNNETGEYILTTGLSKGGIANGVSTLLYSMVEGNFVLKGKVSSECSSNTCEPVSGAGFVVSENLNTNFLHMRYYSPWRMNNNSGLSYAGQLIGGQKINDELVTLGKTISTDEQDGQMELVREGDRYSFYYINKNTDERVLYENITLPYTDPVYVGIYTLQTSSSKDELVLARFTDVELITSSSVSNWALY